MEGFRNFFSRKAPLEDKGSASEEVNQEVQPLQTFKQKSMSDLGDLEKAEAVEVAKEILTFFSSDNEILWFRSVVKLNYIVSP